MEPIVYDTHFNINEWFVIGVSAAAFLAIALFPRRFSPLQATFNLMMGIAFGLVFDHTIGVPPFDLYDVGDNSEYEWMDFFSYLMYVPFGYLFIYIYEWLRLSGWLAIPYILLWAGLSVGLELAGVQVGVFHYKNGYEASYSYPIYLGLMSLYLLMYRLSFARSRWQKPGH